MAGLVKVLAMAGAAGIGWLLLSEGEANAKSGGRTNEERAADRILDAAERTRIGSERAEQIRFQLVQTLRQNDPNLMLALAGVLERTYGVPRTAQNLRAHANHVASSRSGGARYTRPKPGEPGGAPASSLPGADKVPPPDVITRMAEVVATSDPDKLRALADELDRRGFKTQAADLRATAVIIDRERQRLAGAITSPGQPTASRPAAPSAITPPPPMVPAVPGVPVTPAPSAAAAVDPRQMLAAKTALMLTNSSKGNEDKELVRLFQVQEQDAGRYMGSLDGLYGPKTALPLLHYGIVPPKPFYWPKKATEQAKQDYRRALLQMAQRDPPRADEWTAAARV